VTKEGFQGESGGTTCLATLLGAGRGNSAGRNLALWRKSVPCTSQ